MLLNSRVGEDSWESPGLQRNPTSPSERRSILGVHWKDWCWIWNSNTLATWCEELTHWERPWCWERLRAGGEGDDRGWDGWMASLTQWTWVWVDSGSWWWTGRPAYCGSWGHKGSDTTERLNWTELNWYSCAFWPVCSPLSLPCVSLLSHSSVSSLHSSLSLYLNSQFSSPSFHSPDPTTYSHLSFWLIFTSKALFYHVILGFQCSVQFSSVTQSCPTLCDPRDCSTPGLPVHHQLPEFIQTHVHWDGDAILPSHPLSSPCPPTFKLSQYQGLFQWISSSHQVAKVLEFQLQHQSFQWIFRTDFI